MGKSEPGGEEWELKIDVQGANHYFGEEGGARQADVWWPFKLKKKCKRDKSSLFVQVICIINYIARAYARTGILKLNNAGFGAFVRDLQLCHWQF